MKTAIRILVVAVSMLRWISPGAAESAQADSATVQFNRDVRRILSEHCWHCHGVDAASREGDLRLDQHDGALRGGHSGNAAIVPGDSASSELYRRIVSEDPDVMMPPPDSGRSLSSAHKEVLRLWIDQGGTYQTHWSFEPISRPQPPVLSGSEHPIDAFVGDRLRAHGLDFAPEASRETLMRRVSFDLVGLPPSLDDLNRSDESYEQFADRLLSSPHFGERMAVDWLDTARYADTNGYFSDKPRQMWLWRDWVIEAFNRNMPFDQFTIEQLAGDLLPDSGVSQKIATGFNRNHVANNETGIIDEEFRTEYVVDRVDTTMTTWTGLTVGCAQCHDHKYDPITQKDFYQLFAIFNNVPETGLIVTDNPPPVLKVSTDSQIQELAEKSQARALAVDAFEAARRDLKSRISAWESSVQPASGIPTADLLHHEALNGEIAESSQLHGTSLKYERGLRGDCVRLDATQHLQADLQNWNLDEPWCIGFWCVPDSSLSCPLSKIEDDGRRRGLEILWRKKRLTVSLVSHWGTDLLTVQTPPLQSAGWQHVVVDYDGHRKPEGLKIYVNGVPSDFAVQQNSLRGSIAGSEPLRIGRRDAGLGYYGLLDEVRIYRRSLTAEQIQEWCDSERLAGSLETPVADRSSQQTDALLDYYIEHFGDDAIRRLRAEMKAAMQAELAFAGSLPTTLVMEEMENPRKTQILIRGQYDAPGEEVTPDVPASLPAWPAKTPRNRLGFAQWLVSPQHPLTARVAVNRLWRQCFGEGLVRTVSDFGTQGESPSHPELLDWLAWDFRENGWDVKALLRQIVLSRTYRQDSAFQNLQNNKPDLTSIAASETDFRSAALLGTILPGTQRDAQARDPQNRLLSRGPSFRLSAEMLRDQALMVSGLLRPAIGGPSVKPYQPPGLWEEVSYNAEDTYEEDDGEGLWRRSLYTYLKRQAPPPTFLTFDGITREKCVAQRARTNTPLQALTLLNDPTWMEAAKMLAIRILERETVDRIRMDLLFRSVVSRTPEASERDVLLALLDRQRRRFADRQDQAHRIMRTGRAAVPVKWQESSDVTESAAWTVVAHTLFSLDEAIMRR